MFFRLYTRIMIYNPKALKHLVKNNYADLANKLGTDRQRVRQWVVDGRQPAADVLMDICQIFNKSMSYFFKVTK
jgi:hypothetical protein